MILGRIKTLDGLRGIAVLLVLLYHFPRVGDDPISYRIKDAISSLQLGPVGVDIFFVLSGFLITRILIYEKRKGIFSWRKFFIKRALRIFPVYYLVVVLVGLIAGWKDMLPVALYYSNYFFTYYPSRHPLLHVWSLAIEEHFYILWPILFHFWSLKWIRRSVTYLLPLLAVGSALLLILTSDWDRVSVFIYRATHIRIFSLSLGAILAFHETRLSKVKRPTLLILAGVGSILLLRTIHIKFNLHGFGALIDVLWLASASVCLVLGTVGINQSGNAVGRILTWQPLVYTGKISYGIYLYHYPILYILGYKSAGDVSITDFPSAIFVLLLCFLVPAISYILIEKPILLYKDKYWSSPISSVP